MREDKVKIETYNGVDLYYSKNTGDIVFNFDGREQSTRYIFEAQKIIDNPVWEKCDLEGYILDTMLDTYICLAKANKKDKKSGKPYWLIKGRYDREYKKPRIWRETTVYERNEERDNIYIEWKKQADIATSEQNKANKIARSIKNTTL